jgi:hypothetical protein
MGDAVGRPGWGSSFLSAPSAKFFYRKLGTGTKKEKRGRKERNGGLWKLTPLMEIRSPRGFPQRLGKHKTLSTVPPGPTAVPSQDSFFPEAAVHLTQNQRQTRAVQLWSSLRTMRTGSGILQSCRGRGLSAVPFPRPLPLLGDTRNVQRNCNCAHRKLSQWRGSPQKVGNNLGTVTAEYPHKL